MGAIVNVKILPFLFTLIYFAYTIRFPTSTYAVDREQPIYGISLVRLLSGVDNPEGVKVAVVGFFKGSRLYYTREHAELSDETNSIRIVDKTPEANLYRSSCRSKYVKVIGYISRDDSNLWNLIEIEYILDAETKFRCYERGR